MPVDITPHEHRNEYDELLDRWAGGPDRFLASSQGDVPWPRGVLEVVEEYQRLVQMLCQVNRRELRLAGDPARMPSCLHGVYAAAAWSIGMRWGGRPQVLTPVTLIPAPVTGDQVRIEFETAGQIVGDRSDRWPHCTGVIAWIAWATGIPGRDLPSTTFRVA